MEKKSRNGLKLGVGLLAAFVIWTVLIVCVDVQPAGVNGTDVGFAGINLWFHQLTGVHMSIYTLTDILEIVPLLVCVCFGGIGLYQLIKRKSLLQVDTDILILGIYYIVVIAAFVLFEVVSINYRPVLIDGKMEASYPSSTTLLVLCVMPTLRDQVGWRIQNSGIKTATTVFAVVFSTFMVVGRIVAGVHWITDIIGAVLLSGGLFTLYRFFVTIADQKKVKSNGELVRMGKSLSEMTLQELWQLFPIVLTEHQECWNDWYRDERELLAALLPESTVISHVGSTAINGIWAKPIVDILIEIPKESKLGDIKQILVKNGYICMSESDSRISFNKGYTENGFAEKVFHIHVRLSGDNDEVIFRDYLNIHKEIAKEYEQLKLKLWKTYEYDRDSYTEAKTDFIKKTMEAAKREANQTK